MVLFAFGHGMITLLMVILVPRIVPMHLVPLGLGLHKSMEMASTTTSQTLSGLWLDSAQGVPENTAAGTGLLRFYWTTNALQLGCAILLWRLEEWRRARPEGPEDGVDLSKAEEYEVLPMTTLEDNMSDADEDVQKPPPDLLLSLASGPTSALAKSDRERRRGRYLLVLSLGWIGLAWVVFLGTAWVRL